MTYEKAKAEVVLFEHEYFMILSKGKWCSKIGNINGDICFDFDKGERNYEWEYVCRCGDIADWSGTVQLTPCNVIFCSDVSDPTSGIVQ